MGYTQAITMETRQGGDGVFLVRRGLDGEELEARHLLVSDVADLQVSPDGRRIFVSSRSAAQSSEIAVLDAATLESERVIATGMPRWTLAPDGQTIAAGGNDGSIASYDVTSGRKTVFDGRHNARVQGIGFSPDGKVLVSTGDDREVMVWDVPSHSLREILHGHAGRAFGPAFDRDGRTAFTVGLDGRVIAWDLEGERRIGLPSRFDAKRLDGDDVIAASADGGLIALAQNSDLAISQGYDAVSVLAVDGPTLDELYGLGYDYSDRDDAKYEAVKIEQIKTVANKFLKEEALVIAIVKPQKV
jgi:WD40 repeat protein